MAFVCIDSSVCSGLYRTGPGAPSSVKGLCTVVLWGQPSQPNGVITGFDVQFYIPGVFSGTMYRKGKGDIFHIVQDSDRPSRYSVEEYYVGVSEGPSS